MRTTINAPIGVFDSGTGGLTVARGIAKHLPQEQIVYFGDTIHLPYGDKSEETILNYCYKISDWLLDKGCKIIVIACNTASAVSYEHLKKYLEGKALVISVIEPMVEAVVKSACKHIGLIATPRTITSNIYSNKLQLKNPVLKVSPKVTRSLASIIEEGMFAHQPVMRAIIAYYLNDPVLRNIDSLILGCTHYPIIREAIQAHLGEHITVFDSTDIVAHYVKKLLIAKNLLCNTPSNKPHEFYISDYTTGFARTAEMFFGDAITVQHCPLWES